MTEISESGFTYVVPDLLADKVKFSKVYVNYGVMEKETSFGIDMSILEMGLTKTLRSRDLDLLPGKVEAALHSWEKKYRRFLDAKEQQRKEADLDQMNVNAASEIDNLKGILAHTLDVHDAIDWDLIKITGDARINNDSLFEDGVVPDFIKFDESGRPVSFDKISIPSQPTLHDTRSEFGIFSQTFRGEAIKQRHEEQTGTWTKEELDTDRKNEQQEEKFNDALSAFDSQVTAFEDEKRLNNQALENIRKRYQESEHKAIEEYCDLVLDSSVYPDYFPKNWLLEYRPHVEVLVDYDLPIPDQLPSVESYASAKDSDAVVEQKMTAEVHQELYSSMAYQVCIRTIHELFEADVIDALDLATFNGFVSIVNPATGKTERKCILSVSSQKNAFMEFDLGRVDPRATFEHMRGIIGGPLYELISVTPLASLGKTDKRFL
jgi:restriction system protein